MNFASFPYLVFLAITVWLYYFLNLRFRNIFLLFASYFFYAVFGLGFALLMLVTSLITFVSSHYCYYSVSKVSQKVFFYVGLGLDLAVFILFKYTHLINMDLMNWPHLSVQSLLIPIGISFYTFKTVGYCIDIYKRKYEPERNFVFYALSVSFFPQLIAGPIEKSIIIADQLRKSIQLNLPKIIEGGKLILWGMFKKIVIADSIALLLNPLYSDIQNYRGLDLLIISFAFIYQVYTDFSGYSDIAIGSAKCFGVELPPNFNKPFFATGVRNYWSRWHASMTRWLREYIYIPLGGNRVSIFKELMIVLLVFVITGLWHGAALNYMLFALTAYFFLLADVATNKFRHALFKRLGIANTIVQKVLGYLAITFMVTVMCIFFRPASMSDSIYILQNITNFGPSELKPTTMLYLFGIILLFEMLQYFQITPAGSCFEGVKKFSYRAVMYIAITFSIILSSSKPDMTFQYFQF